MYKNKYLKIYVKEVIKEINSKINSQVLEEDERTLSYRMMWNQWLHTVFQGTEKNFKPFVNAVYNSSVKRKKLEERWNILKNSPSQSQASNIFYDFLKEKFELNNNSFRKEFIGDFFMENKVNPYDLFYDLKFFIKPNNDFSKWRKNKTPSSRSSSPDFKFHIDESQWDKFSANAEKNKLSREDLNFDNLSRLSVGDMTSLGKVIKVDRGEQDV